MIRHKRMSYRLLLAVACLGVMVGAVSAWASPAVAGVAPTEPWWRLNSTSAPTNMPLEGESQIVVTAINAGDGELNATRTPVTFTDELPQGVTAVAINEAKATRGVPGKGTESEGIAPSCSLAASVVACKFTKILPPYVALVMRITVKTDVQTATASLKNVVTVRGGETVQGGEVRPGVLKQSLAVNGRETPFGVEMVEMAPESGGAPSEGEGGAFDAQAGSHPFQITTTLNFNEKLAFYKAGELSEGFGEYPTAPSLPRDVHLKLPPGLVGDPGAVPQCSETDFSVISGEDVNLCPADTAIGVAFVTVNVPNPVGFGTFAIPVFNLVPAPGEPARFGFEVYNVPVVFKTVVPSGGEYGVEVVATNLSEAGQVLTSQVTLWGVPGDARHDQARGWECLAAGTWDVESEAAKPCVPESQQAPKAFVTMPTSCAQPPVTSVSGESWPTGKDHTPKVIEEGENTTYTFPRALSGCGLLPFDPSISVFPVDEHEGGETPAEEAEEAEGHPPRASVTAGSTPTGVNVNVTMPQEATVSGEAPVAEADVEETTVTLPEGMLINPSAANGLEACSVLEFGSPFEGSEEDQQTGNTRFTPAPPNCKEASKVGTVSIETPLLENQQLTGAIYLAGQDTNPFSSPLVLYLVAEDPTAGVLVKLAGTVAPNPGTGQLESTFKNTPRLPFSHLKLHFFEGQRASVTTPAACGTQGHETTAAFTAWSGASTQPKSAPFDITSGPGGAPCSSPLPFGPSFVAGPTNSQAAGFTPFVLRIGHADGQQPLKSITMQLPPGVSALLSQVTPCSEERVVSDRCGPESLIGRTNALSGLGGEPVSLGGEVYLTGALKATSRHGAAPFGLLAVTHAAVGPFDLGEVPVLSTLTVNPTTAAATIQSEPIPDFVKGVPAQLKQLEVIVERPGNQPFEVNPTNCVPPPIAGTLTGYEGASVGVAYPFPVSNCASLPFGPKLTAEAAGQGSKAGGTSLKVKVTSAGLGQANIAKVDLTIPAALPSRLTTIQKACPAAVFEANPASCDEGSVIGKATVHTPVLSNPLTGPGYLVSHGGAEFPDVEFVLQGEGIKLVLDGKTDIKKGVTYSKFESTPDAPFTTFETELPAGPHSAFTPNVPEKEDFNLCRTSLSMPTTITGQNGAVIEQDTKIAVTGCIGVKPFKKTKLEEVLETCKKKYKKHKDKSKRLACEKRARKQYGTKKAGKKSSTKKK